MSKLRKQFEAWHEATYSYIPTVLSNGKFDSDMVEQRWQAYQAALEPVRELVDKWHADVEDALGERDYETAEAIDKCIRELAKLLEE